MSAVGFLGDLVAAFGKSFAPLEQSLANAGSFSAFLAEFGWSLDPSSDINVVQTALGTLPHDLQLIPQVVTELEKANNGEDLGAVITALGDLETVVKDVVKTVQGLSQTSASTVWPAPLNSKSFWDTFPLELLDYLLYEYIEAHAPRLFASLRTIGVLSEGYVVPSGGGRVAYVSRTVNWDRLIGAISQPQHLLADVYGWGGKFDAQGLLDSALGLAAAFGTAANHRQVPQEILDAYYDQSAPGRSSIYELTVPIYYAMTDSGSSLGTATVELAVLPIPPPNLKSVGPVGVVIYPRVTGSEDTKFDIVPGSLTAEFKGGFESEGLVRAEIRPGAADVFVDPTLGSTQLDASATIDSQPAQPWILLGQANGTRLEVKHAHASIRATGPVSPASDLEFIAELAADSGAVVIDFGEGDGFLQTVLHGSQRMEFGLGLTWSSKHGLLFSGQATLETTIPINQSIAGLINLDSIYVAFRASGTGASLVAAATGGISIGPVDANLKRVGLSLDLTPVPAGQPSGNLGKAELGFSFKPPEGISVGIDAPGVSGIGLLDIDTEHHQYLGVLGLSVADVDIEAVGVLNTQLPTGKGYSLVILAAATFPPVELGFGFSLDGLGGLVGINRTVDVPGIQALARSGGLDELMFPDDLVHKAPQVVAALATLFPPADGHFIIGPAVEIEWGEDGILDAELGIFIELSDIGGGITILRVALLGWFHLTLPDADAPVADITLDILGVLDIPAKTISIDAGLRDSKLAGFTLTGQAALRAGWGDNAAFVLALGGFNPHFQAPAGFPALDRIALSLGGDNPRVRMSSYLALTSNTVQLGASADLYASAGPAAVTASLSFDVLVQLKPLGLIVDLTISASILFNGSPLMSLNLDLHLTGPNPWHVQGKASFSVLFFSVSVPIDITVGSSDPPQLPQTVDLDANLAGALVDLRSWQIGPPPGASAVVIRGSDQPMRAVHPMGQLTVRQRAVPLAQRVERYGADLLDHPCVYDIPEADIASQQYKSPTTVTDFFAPAQFITMDDATKLSSPSFEPMTAGVTIGPTGFTVPSSNGGTPKSVDTPSTRDWDLLILDSPDPSQGGASATSSDFPVVNQSSKSGVRVSPQLLSAQQSGSAASVRGANGQGASRFYAPATGIGVKNPSYAVATLRLASVGPPGSPLLPLASHSLGQDAVIRLRDSTSVQVLYMSELPGAQLLK